MNYLDLIIGMLAPYACLGCGQEGALLCAVCEGYFPPPLEQISVKGIAAVRAATLYEGIAKDLVWHLKFRGARSAADIMARSMAPLLSDEKEAVIIPVPTATKRVRQRGFDQAKLLAKRLAGHTGIRYRDCLRRHGQTEQVGASRRQRLVQLEDAFSLKTPNLVAKTVILIDDVMTTGATLEAAANIVKTARVQQVKAVVFGQVEQLLG